MSTLASNALALPLASMRYVGMALLFPLLACALYFIWQVMRDAGRGKLASIIVALCIMTPTVFYFLASSGDHAAVRISDHSVIAEAPAIPDTEPASFGQLGPYGRVALGLVGLAALLHLLYAVIDSITRRHIARTRIAIDCLLVILVFAAIIGLT